MHNAQIGISILKYINIMTKYSTLLVILLFSMITNSIHAQPYVALDNQNKIELNEHDLWFQTQSLDTNPSFLALS